MNFKLEIRKILEPQIGKEFDIEIPPNPEMGDFALPCFTLAKTFKKGPNEIAQDILKKIRPTKYISEIKVSGPYLNFFINKSFLIKETLQEIFKKKGRYGAHKKNKERVMIEYSQANTHKAFHVGHIRGTSLGESLARILKFYGFSVVQANYQGDTGAHVAKWLWAYLKYHKGETPPKVNLESWIANIYVEAVKKLEEVPAFQEEVNKINLHLENKSDKSLIKLWSKTRKLSLIAFEKIYRDLGAHFDYYFFEREVEKRGREIALELLKKGIAEESDGAVIINLEKYSLGVWVLLRKDGTCLYSAKDLALAELKFKKYKIDRNLYVVGAAQSLHLKQLFKTLELMGFKNASKCYHLSFSEVRLPTGKMSSRTGQNVLYSDMKSTLIKYALNQVKSRHEDWAEKKINESANNIAIAALKFNMLAPDNNKLIIFDYEKVLKFEGDTGPYVQYAHARICSILKKSKLAISNPKYDLLDTEEESNLIRQLSIFPQIVLEAERAYKPNIIANYALELTRKFNKFYELHKVLTDSEDLSRARLVLISAVKQVLANSLYLLGIDAPSHM